MVARSSRGIRVLVVDSTPMGSQLLADVLKREGFQVIAAGTTADFALEQLSNLETDVLLLSSTLDGADGTGFELAAQVRDRGSQAHIVMLLEKPDRQSVVRAFRSGAHGVLGRDSSLGSLAKCVQRVHEGQIWASTEELAHVLAELETPQQIRLVSSTGDSLLARREQEVVHWVAEGLTNREIGERLGLSENTVKNYLFRIFDKLGISKRVELVLYAASQSAARRSSELTRVGPSFDDETSLFRWCRTAVEQIAFLPLAVAEMLLEGRGTSCDRSQALTWFIIAEQLADDLYPNVQAAKLRLQRELSDDEVCIARAQALEWLRKKMPQTEDEWDAAV